MKEQFKMVICPQCMLEIWYSTAYDHIACTKCGFKVPVEPYKTEEEIEEAPGDID